MDEALHNAARTAVEQCLDLKDDETFVVVTDNERKRIGDACAEAAEAITEDVVTVLYPVGEQHGEEPPSPVAGALKQTDAFLAPTTKSLSHTAARKDATDSGARGATLPGITEDVFVTGMQVDYDVVAEHCSIIRQEVDGASEIHVASPAGTDLTLNIEGRSWHSDTGIVHTEGTFANLPAGEVYISPTSANGTLVIDGSMRPHGQVENPIVFTIEDGQVVDVNDEAVAEMLEDAAEEADNPAAVYNVAELGIGANTAVETLTGNILLDEKAAGTTHVAIGHDASMGGDVVAPIHEDGVLYDPRFTVDGDEVQFTFD